LKHLKKRKTEKKRKEKEKGSTSFSGSAKKIILFFKMSKF